MSSFRNELEPIEAYKITLDEDFYAVLYKAQDEYGEVYWNADLCNMAIPIDAHIGCVEIADYMDRLTVDDVVDKIITPISMLHAFSAWVDTLVDRGVYSAHAEMFAEWCSSQRDMHASKWSAECLSLIGDIERKLDEGYGFSGV